MAKKPDVVLRAEEKAARVYAKVAPLLERANARWQKVKNDPAFWRGIVEHFMEKRRNRASVNRKNARQPRGKRMPTLAMRGLQCVLRENPDITAGTLKDWLEGQSQTYDDDDIELSLDGDAIVVRDLSRFGRTQSIKKSALRVYLKRARNS